MNTSPIIIIPEALDMQLHNYEIHFNNEVYNLSTSAQYIGSIHIETNQTRIYIGLDLFEKLEKTKSLDNLNIRVFEKEKSSQNIVMKYILENYILENKKYYPNGKRCGPICYAIEPIYLIKVS